MEAGCILEMAKDAGGSRVIEAFFDSNASGKHKRKIVAKLKGHFGELSMRPSNSFTVDKCFSVSNMSLKEVIVSELVAIRTELSKTRQGPYILLKFDADGFARQPEQWRSRLKTKETVLKEFYDTFGSTDKKGSQNDHFLSGADHDHTTTHNFVKTGANPEWNSVKLLRMEIDNSLSATSPKTSAKSAKKRHFDREEIAKHTTETIHPKREEKNMMASKCGTYPPDLD